MTHPNTVLDVSGLTVAIDGQLILEDVGLTLNAERIHVVLGASGSGKTTLLRTLAGLSGPGATVSANTFRLCATDQGAPGGGPVQCWDLNTATERDWAAVRARRIGIVFQDPQESLTPLRRTGSLLREVLRNTGRHAAGQCGAGRRRTAVPPGTEDCTGLLQAAGLGHHDGIENNYCFELSGGMSQRLGLALAVAGQPVLLLADEPSTALDGVARRRLVDSLRAQAAAGAAVLLVTHDRSLARTLADDISVLANGRCIESGPASEVLTAPAHRETRTLLADFPPSASSLPGPGIPADTILLPPAMHRPPALRLRGVRHHYSSGGPEVLRGLDLDLAAGESLGLLGRSGSGKSTLIKCLVGLEKPAAGMIAIAGMSTSEARWRPLRRQIQLVPQDPRATLNPWRSVLEQVMDPLDFHGIGSRNQRRTRATGLLEDVGLGGYGRRRPGQLSTGQCQRVSIARALAIGPSVLVADEPVTALDAHLRAEMLDLLRRLSGESGTALLVVSHDLQALEELCPRIAVLDEGRIVEVLRAGRLDEASSTGAREIIDAHWALSGERNQTPYRKASA